MKKISLPKGERKREPMSLPSKIMMLVLSLVALVLVILTFVDMAGYHLLASEVIPMGCVAEVILLLAWAAMAIYRRRRTDRSKRIALLVSAMIIMMLGLFLSSYIMQYAQVLLPTKYAVIKSPTGEKVAILSMVDNGFGGNEDTLAMLTRMQQRQLYRDSLASGEPMAEMPSVPAGVPVDENGEIVYDESGILTYSLDSYDYETYGYIYAAYPIRGLFFYTSNVPSEGLVYRGVESSAKLLSDWVDDNTLSLYLENPEPGDSGTCRLSLHPAADAAN